jgi:hypothetical protein
MLGIYAQSVTLVKLPRSALRRGALTWSKLLDHVDADARNGFGFQGRILRPGALVALEELPEPAVLVECAGSDGSGHGHRRSATTYILWQFDRARGEWRELARAASVGREWASDLRSIALRALGHEPAPFIPPTTQETIARVLALVEGELRGVRAETVLDLMGALHDRLAAHAAAQLPVMPLPQSYTGQVHNHHLRTD